MKQENLVLLRDKVLKLNETARCKCGHLLEDHFFSAKKILCVGWNDYKSNKEVIGKVADCQCKRFVEKRKRLK